jgi:hypothetical protein
VADGAPAGVLLAVGEVVDSGSRRFHVAERDLDSVIAMRRFLIEEARARATVTYGELVATLKLPCPPKGLGRLLVLLSEDCYRRGEPTLAAIVVTQATGEVGDGYGDGASADRSELYAHWA